MSIPDNGENNFLSSSKILPLQRFSLRFECQQVFTSLQDSSQYSGLSPKCFSLDSLHSSSSPFNNPSVSVEQAPFTMGIIVTFMFFSIFNSQAKPTYLSFFLHPFSFILGAAGTAKSTILQILFLLLIILW